MRLRDHIKKYLPSYRTEARLAGKMEKIEKDLREIDNKNEYLFWLSQMQPGETMQETKERIFLKMPKATGRLRNIQLAENHILQRVKDICDANGLQMFLIGGTLLGAVRHKGFIPWDNDIDIGMMDEDYLKLKELLVNDDELYTAYYYNYKAGLKIPKVKYRGTDFFWIDIFKFDYIDADPDVVEAVWNSTKEINSAYSSKIRKLAEANLDKYGGRPLADVNLDESLLEIEKIQKNTFGRFGHGKYFCETLDSPYWSRNPRGMNLIDDRFPLLKDAVEFEGKKYDVWKNYEDALIHFYGDFWKLPFSINEPHTSELDEGFDEAIQYLKSKGII